MFRLLISSAGGKAFARELSEEDVIVGRSSSADVSVPDRAMSRRHARFYQDGSRWYVEDLGSRNGTRLNGEVLVGARELKPGDRVTIGGTVLTLVERGASGRKSSSGFISGRTIFRPAAELLNEQSTANGMDDVTQLRRLAGRLQLLNDVNHALAESITLDELLDLILERAFAELRPEQGAVFLKDESGGFTCAAGRALGAQEVEKLCSRHLVREVVEKGHAALVTDTLIDDRFQGAVSLLDAGVRSLLAAPLLSPEGALGMIVLCSKATVRTFTEEDMELLASLASIAAMRLRNLKLTQAEVERRKLERDVALARRIQVALLPDVVPVIPGYAVHAGNIPSLGVSGDFYKVVSRGDGREVVFMVADVSGKGIGAALLTGALESLSAAPIENGWLPEEIFETVSRLLYDRTSAEKYATAFLAVLEPESGRLRYANAGHPPAFLVRADGSMQHLSSTGMPVGLLPGAKYSPAEASLGELDQLVLYTDGITEAENPEGDEFGEGRLEALCVAHHLEEPAELARRIEEELASFVHGVPFPDDRTVMILQRLQGTK